MTDKIEDIDLSFDDFQSRVNSDLIGKIINNLQLENNVRIERNFGQIKIKNIQYKS